MIQKLIIGAPFGNYLSFPDATSTLGTFTAAYRGGFWKRAWRVVRTLRYYWGIRAWKNKSGLPNPGIAWLAGKTFPDKIISVMGFTTEEWITCVRAAVACKPLAVELNVSCPNCPGEDQTDYDEVFEELVKVAADTELIVKLPPMGYGSRFSAAISAGITSFHCCNTLPLPNGGLSGKPLKPLSLDCIGQIRRYRCIKRIIGGGGVTHINDARDYLNAKSTNVAVASVLLNPFNWKRVVQMGWELSCF